MNNKYNRFEIEVKNALMHKNRVLIHGLPGVGKTQFCYRLCKKSKRNFVFIDCEYDGVFLSKLKNLTGSSNFNEDFRKLCGVMDSQMKNTILIIESIECSALFCNLVYPFLRDLGYTMIMTMRVKNKLVSDIVKENTVCVLRPNSFFDILRNSRRLQYIEMISGHTSILSKLPALYHNDLCKEYEAYLAYGGLPNAFNTYINNELTFEELKNIHEAQYIYALEKILEHSDLDDVNKQYCRQICNSILMQMLEGNYYRFNFASIRKGGTLKIFGKAIDFLVDNNFLIKVERIDDKRYFLLYFYDSGVLYDKLLQLSNRIGRTDCLEHISYMVKRNSVACELCGSDIAVNYWRSDYVAFIDFVIRYKNSTFACKITEKEDKRSRSTDVYANENINVTSVILSNRNFEKQNKKIYIPNYAISCIDEILV